MRIRTTGYADGHRGRVEATSGKFKNRLNLLPRDVVLLDDFLDARTNFEVFKDCSDGHSGVLKHPRAAASVRHTFYGGTL